MNTAGEIVLKATKFLNIEWKLGYSAVEACNRADYVCSEPFKFVRSNCHVFIFRNSSNVSPHYQLGLLIGEENVLNSVDFTLGFSDSSGLLIRFGRNDLVMSTRSKLVCKEIPDIRLYKRLIGTTEMLTVYCEMRYIVNTNVKDVGTQTTKDMTPELCNDLRKLLEKEENTDVTIIVKDHAFLVHQVILASRSDVFAAMFKHDMLEKNNNLVTIIDCHPDVFRDFLMYIYSGEAHEVSRNNVISLYAVAEKYLVSHLKEYCAEIIMHDISPETACDILVLGDRYNNARMKVRAEALILDNWKEIILREEWESFMAENNGLAWEIIQKASQRST